MTRRGLVVAAVAGVAATALSLVVKYERTGGTVRWVERGWPHVFYASGVDFSGVPVDGGFAPGSLGIYIFANVVFYMAIGLLVLAIAKRRHT